MSRRFRFKLNRGGVRELLKSPNMEKVISGHAKATLSSAGEGYDMEIYNKGNRVRGQIRTSSWESVHDNSKNNTLLKVLR